MKRKRKRSMYSMLSFVVLIMCLFFSSTPAIIAANPQQSDRITITGVIKDAHGELMIGATVKVKGQSIGSVTGVDGKYELYDHCDWERENQGELKTIYLNGEFKNRTTLEDVRNRLKESLKNS